MTIGGHSATGIPQPDSLKRTASELIRVYPVPAWVKSRNAEEQPPIRVFGRGHKIACHIAPDELERMDPVITLGDKEAAD
jgi:hypothetical protein